MIHLLVHRLVLRLAIVALGSSVAGICSPAQAALPRVDTKPAVPTRWLCSADSRGDWYNMPCTGNDCTAHCTLIHYCEPKAVSTAITSCSHDGTCTPLVLHRRLARLGCGFNVDSFWTSPNARPAPIAASEAAKALKSQPGKAPLKWLTPSCGEHELKDIEKTLNDPTYPKSTSGRTHVFAVLLDRGCNIDLSQMGPDGEYRSVTLTRPTPTSTDESGTAPQPPVTVAFIPPIPAPSGSSSQLACEKQDEQSVCMDATVPQRPDNVTVCEALRLLHDSRHFAICNDAGDAPNVHVRFPSGAEGPDKFTERIEIDSTGGTTGDHGVHGDGGVNAQPSPTPPPSSSPVSLPTAAAGSAGVGALLATLATRIFGKSKKITGADQQPTVAAHTLQDVHVTVSFRHLPRPPRVRDAKPRTSSPDTEG